MATKANLITAIETQLTAIITQAKVRLASSLIVDNLYSTQINESSSAPSLTIIHNNDYTYKLTFNKIGNMVFLSGRIRNETSSLFAGGVLVISNLEYRPNSDIRTSNGIAISTTGVLSLPAIVNSSAIDFSITYQTND